MKYILLGKSGYIGQAICSELDSRDIPYIGLSREQVNYTNYIQFKNYLHLNCNGGDSIKTSMILNCAGYIGKPNVDACEDNIESTIKGNVMLPLMLNNISIDRGIPLVHISSGCIYTGYDKHFTENDASNFDFQNGSVYSGSKAAAERLIREQTDNHYIFRLRIPFDRHPSPRNYITKMLTYNKLLNATNSMSHRGDFAKSVIDLLEMRAPCGTYNITNPGSIDTKTVVSMMRSHLELDHDIKFYEDMSSFMKDVKAPRSNCVLSTKKVQDYIDIRNVNEAMETTIRQYGTYK